MHFPGYARMHEEGGPEGMASGTLSFSMLLDKNVPYQVELASWNPGKDLLAMLTSDHQLVLHRLNWQKLWTVTPDLKVTAICWRPDGKALAVGHSNGSIAIHDVENGDILRKTQSHQVEVTCLHWAEESQSIMEREDNVFIYEDRTSQFFPPPPKPPPMPGTVPVFDMSSVLGSTTEDLEGSTLKGTTGDMKHRLDVLCSGDKDGLICLSAFGVFPIGKLGMRELELNDRGSDGTSKNYSSCRLVNACALQVSLSNDLRRMTVVCSGRRKPRAEQALAGISSTGLCCISVDTALLGNRRKEFRQVAHQASSIEELLDVLQVSLTVMRKHWSEAIDSFEEKLDGFSVLISEHGLISTPRDEFLGLLTWGYFSPALHQFLAASLGEAGLKRLSKIIDTAARELQITLSEHMQPAAEIIMFRLGELRGLSRWKSRLDCVGLEESLLDQALEHAGMLLVQLERLVHVISDTAGGFRPFFVWLVKVLRQMNRDALTQSELPSVDSEAVASFLQNDFGKNEIGGHLNNSQDVTLDFPGELLEMMQEVATIGGYADFKFLQRTLAQEVDLLILCCQEAFTTPLKVVSPQLGSPHIILLCHAADSSCLPISLTHFEVNDNEIDDPGSGDRSQLLEYVCFQMSSGPRSEDPSVVGVLRGFGGGLGRNRNESNAAEAITLRIDENLLCVDLALYKNRQLLLLVAQRDHDEEGSGRAWLLQVQLKDLEFRQLGSSGSTQEDLLHQCASCGASADIGLKDGKVRVLQVPDVVAPLAVSSSRGLACVFTTQRRVLLFDLEEDEEMRGNEDLD